MNYRPHEIPVSVEIVVQLNSTRAIEIVTDHALVAGMRLSESNSSDSLLRGSDGCETPDYRTLDSAHVDTKQRAQCARYQTMTSAKERPHVAADSINSNHRFEARSALSEVETQVTAALNTLNQAPDTVTVPELQIMVTQAEQ